MVPDRRAALRVSLFADDALLQRGDIQIDLFRRDTEETLKLKPFQVYPAIPCRGLLVLLLIVTAPAVGLAQSETSAPTNAVSALIKAYPDFLARIEANDLVWKDGTRMRIDDGKGAKTFDALLDDPDIKDMFLMKYPLGEQGLAPAVNFDPGRVRYAPLFKKMYGDCRTGDVMAKAVNVVWLPSKYGKNLKFSKINGAAAALQHVSDGLDKLPQRFLAYLRPTQGTYNCRLVAGTNRESAHGLGIAIDIAAAHSHYWQWSKPDADGRFSYKNEIPWEIVEIFEKHGFIWGGKWYHYDTMHFEYRPEIILSAD
jgi:D-alanyl-D-alanine carboxypeptidase